jgi:multidrug efflux pump
VDGTNTTLNSGRIQINLKDREERRTSATDIIRRLAPEVAKVNGIQCYLQPLQDLTVENRVSRTQYQYSVEDANAKELAVYADKLEEAFKAQPALADVASDQQLNGLQAELVIDRDTASRLGITPQNIDDTLDDAFGQRQVSTMLTQLNQYHVILEVEKKYQQNPDSLNAIYVRSSNGTQVPLSTFTRFVSRPATLAMNHLRGAEPDAVYTRVCSGRDSDAGDLHPSSDCGGVPLFARGEVYSDPQLLSAAEPVWNLRSDVCAGLHAGQPVPDGADDLDRVCGG